MSLPRSIYSLAATITPSSSTVSNRAAKGKPSPCDFPLSPLSFRNPTTDPGDGDTEVRCLRAFCEKYWNRGDEGRAEIYKIESIKVRS
jgi:hypothetical protein